MERCDGQRNAFKEGDVVKCFVGVLCQGKKDEAEPFSRRSLEMVEKTHGSDHPSVAVSMKNLADLLEAQVRSKKYFNLV